jgi:hypothetical protein
MLPEDVIVSVQCAVRDVDWLIVGRKAAFAEISQRLQPGGVLLSDDWMEALLLFCGYLLIVMVVAICGSQE